MRDSETISCTRRRLFSPQDLRPLNEQFEVCGVFNPAVAEAADGTIRLVARVAHRPIQGGAGRVRLPRWENGKPVIDELIQGEVSCTDPRIVRLRDTGTIRLPFLSTLAIFHADNFCSQPDSCCWQLTSEFLPGDEYEEFGVEDPRLTCVDGRYLMTYVAVSRHGVATALAETRDFVSFDRHGLIFVPENKDVVLFPERLNGRYVALHRPVGASGFSRPEIWLAESEDLIHWGRHRQLFGGRLDWENGRVGAGVPPIKTGKGWLVIYHANQRAENGSGVGRYVAAAMLLDLDQPARIVAVARQPLFVPQETFECEGFVPNVVFPTGAVCHGDHLHVFYGAADTHVGVVTVALEEVFETLEPVLC